MTDTESRPARRTGRPPLTDRATLLAAAREIGFSDLTVGAVTTRVGVKYSTFYRHFPSLEALVAALVDDVVTDAVFPDVEGRWQEQLLAFAAATFDLMAEHPGLAPAMVRLPDEPDAIMTAFRRLSDQLLAVGFTAEDAVLAAGTAAQMGMQPWLCSNGRGAGDLRRREQVLESAQAFDPQVRGVFRDRIDDPPRSWTLRRVELVIAGLETRLPA
ncbi:TetR/AcrR family transcriptional regulator [Pseudonocardia parietis]|uniref:AcrR family transcriptional regulator n=1 Tax=Pseudonocardia parietis TaxID=570936 RepID=A0ABS4W0Q1_9PSEU|nr:TetR/AcrR family transcriptional regulator [Pseudonocardia parietis]MBP2369678.1 AcrR family transcriptional regulator [Pseudonocardia parietis]